MVNVKTHVLEPTMKTLNMLMNRLLMSAVLLAMLNACGGGNGSAGAPMGGGGSNTNGLITLELLDESGNAVTTISTTGQVIATVVDAFDSPVPNVIVTFTLSKNPDIVTMDPHSDTDPHTGLVSTDSSGKALLRITPVSGNSGASGEVTATAVVVTGTTITDAIGFRIQ
jgi:hypothetical protein